MPVTERYQPTPGVEPRPCQWSGLSDESDQHPAEVVLNDGQLREGQFLCKAHASLELAQNHVLLAKAVIELSLLPYKLKE
jgi:hypothetical protein